MGIDWDAYHRMHDAGGLSGLDPSIEDLTIRQPCDPILTVDQVNAAMGRGRPPQRQALPGYRFDSSADTEAWLESGRFT